MRSAQGLAQLGRFCILISTFQSRPYLAKKSQNLTATLCFVLLIFFSQTIAQASQITLASQTAQASQKAPDPELIQQLKQSTQSDSFKDAFSAQVWLMDMSQRLKPYMPDAKQRLVFLRQLHQEAYRHGIMPELILALIEVESHFRAKVTSSAGAEGLMQVMPFWRKEIGRSTDNLFDPATNLKYGCAILAYYLKKEHYDVTRALARYNGSLGQTIYPEKVMRAWARHWQPR
ncbi:lytic transglycosylase domain-containing protein [Oceanospirillum maris]|uniref:lytic transglycosylase domain-containing protein n=1 Tax=Oceanospirillum maris TaxID=64977 RepID=UPI0003FFBB99|nr:lytic transglycosylase domain-containing protein [Oceanospirillum maris]